MLANTQSASWDLDAMHMLPTIADLGPARPAIEAQLTKRFPSNAQHSILEALFAADEHVTLVLSRNMAVHMQSIAAKQQFEPKDEHTEAVREAIVNTTFKGMMATIKDELTKTLLISVTQFWDKDANNVMRVDCNEAMNPPSVLDAGKLVAVCTFSTGAPGPLLIFHFVFDKYSMIEAILKNTIEGYLKDLAASRPKLFEVICDSSNNSEDDIANHRLNVDIISSDPDIARALQELGGKPVKE